MEFTNGHEALPDTRPVGAGALMPAGLSWPPAAGRLPTTSLTASAVLGKGHKGKSRPGGPPLAQEVLGNAVGPFLGRRRTGSGYGEQAVGLGAEAVPRGTAFPVPSRCGCPSLTVRLRFFSVLSGLEARMVTQARRGLRHGVP